MAWVPDGFGGWRQDDPNDTSPPPLGPSSTSSTTRPRTLPVSGGLTPPEPRSSAPAQASTLYSAPQQTQLSPPPSAFQPPPPRPAAPPPPPPAPGDAPRIGTARQAQTAPAATPPPTGGALTPEEQDYLARRRTLQERNGTALVADDPQYAYSLIEKKAGLKPGTVTWDYGMGQFVINTGSGAPLPVSDAQGNLNAGNVELARSLGMTVEQPIAEEQAPAVEQEQSEVEQNIRENNEAAQATVDSVLNEWRNANQLDTTAADESRRLQEAVFARQTAIINRILDFDPEAYARMFGDQALGGLLSAARSARGGAGAVNAALFSAQQQAPQLFAEGARQAAQIENQRLGMAGDVAAQSGQLATDVRTGDEQRSQFTADLGVRVMQGITEITGMDLQLDARAQEQLGAMALEFAQLYQQYVGMDLQTQLAQWDNLMRKYAVDEQSRLAMEQIRAQLESNKIGWDDVGLALLSTGGQVGAGYFAGRR